MQAGFRIKYDEWCRRNCKERQVLHPKIGSKLHSAMRGKRIGEPQLINHLMNRVGTVLPSEIEHGHYHNMYSGIMTRDFDDGLSYTTSDYDGAEALVDFSEFFADDRHNNILREWRPMQWVEESESDEEKEYDPAPDIDFTAQPLLTPVAHRTRSRTR